MEARNVPESKGTVTFERERFRGIRMENPFTLKVGQVFTGFGIGCGVGIGVGRPINMGNFPSRYLLFLSTSFFSSEFSISMEIGAVVN